MNLVGLGGSHRITQGIQMDLINYQAGKRLQSATGVPRRRHAHKTPGSQNGLRTERPSRSSAVRVLLVVLAVLLCSAAPRVTTAQNCKLHYAEAFQNLSLHSFSGLSPASIRQTVDDLFGPRIDLCSEDGYSFFLRELGTQAAAALRKKGTEQEVALGATREVMSRIPRLVRFSPGIDPAAGLNQLRSNLGVLSREVGLTPAARDLLDALAALSPPVNLPQASPGEEEAIPIVVPQVPLPAWAILSLHEIREHAGRNEVAAVTLKVNRILDWLGRLSATQHVTAPTASKPSGAK